jgi:hypothetical protein
LASLELRADADEGDQMWRVDRSPAGLGGLDQQPQRRRHVSPTVEAIAREGDQMWPAVQE